MAELELGEAVVLLDGRTWRDRFCSVRAGSVLLRTVSDANNSEAEEIVIVGWRVEHCMRGRAHPKRGPSKQAMISVGDPRSTKEIVFKKRGLADFGSDTERWMSALRDAVDWNPDDFVGVRDSDVVWWAQLFAVLAGGISLLDVLGQCAGVGDDVSRQFGILGARYRGLVGRLLLRPAAVIKFAKECGLSDGACESVVEALGSLPH